jgi:hypothetical protein
MRSGDEVRVLLAPQLTEWSGVEWSGEFKERESANGW